jgi:lactate dehydrogenase-like 2-hydroxyacid dehydrogenase
LKIAVLDTRTLGEDIDLSGLSQFGDVEYFSNIEEREVAEKLSEKDVLVTNKVRLHEGNLERLKNLKLICLTATGYNNVDIDYTNKRNITVCNVAGYSTNSVVQHTFSMLFHLISRMDKHDRFVKSRQYEASGTFTRLKSPFCEISGKKWGIIGLGNIGSQVAEVATAFGAQVSYYSTSGAKRITPYDSVDLEKLLSESDIISIHAPLNEDTKYLLDLNRIKKMKKNSILINVARGGIVKEDDLVRALNEEYIKGACLDVFETEPLRSDSPLYKVKDSDKIVLSPHVAWSSVEAREKLIKEILLNIESFLKGEPRNVVGN